MNAPTGDQSAALQEHVRQAISARQPLRIVGADSKRFIALSARRAAAIDTLPTLSTAVHSGITRHEPTELVLSARAGTPVQSIIDTLARHRQQLPFEPPVLGSGTLGGLAACGLSGPARPFAGSLRDHVLGCRFINGKGEILSVGGEVMKNVAGYDIARLQVGAFGTLGVLLDLSLKVLPMPEYSATVQMGFPGDSEALSSLPGLVRRPLPLSALAVHEGQRFARLSGARSAVEAAMAALGGDVLTDDEADAFWTSLREFSHPHFTAQQQDDNASLWRISTPAEAPPLTLAGHVLYDWAGGLRWYVGNASSDAVFAAAASVGGHAQCYSAALKPEHAVQPLPRAMQTLQERLRLSFDPESLFNP